MHQLRDNYRLIAFDIDGTLVKNNKEMSILTKQTLRELNSHGVCLAIATGRPMIGTRWLTAMIADDMPVISCNGAIIRMSKTERLLYEKNLTLDAIQALVNVFSQKNYTYGFWSGDEFYVNRLNEHITKYQTINRVVPRVFENDEVLLNLKVNKIIWFGSPQEVLTYQNKILPHYDSLVNYATSNPNFIEIVDKDVSKAQGIAFLEQYYNIDHQLTMAFGDADNDIEMLKYVRTGVAMANASKTCLKIADYVTKSNEEDGIFYAIQQLVK